MEDAEYLAEFEIDLAKVKQHSQLRNLLFECEEKEYVKLAVGVSDPLANYSADEHQLGLRILDSNSHRSVFRLAQKLAAPDLTVTHVPDLIYKANFPYLKIGIGSEMACLLQPNRFWVGNVRTIWSHLVIKHKGDWEKANEELALYRIDDATSEMHYQIWREIYLWSAA